MSYQFPERDEFLLCPTPQGWIEHALDNQDILLIDHANCEKKAAATALNLMFRYTEHPELLNKMSRLAREELRHFEQVLALMKKRKIPYRAINASRYAGRMRASVRTHEPERMIDTLVVGAFIEARSCERFEALAPYLDEELAKFYLSLLKSEARHFQDYLQLAVDAAGYDLTDRIDVFAEADKDAVLSADTEFRFHSGVPVQEASVQSS
ncbi:tRNA isopentenyl-2-thiomethyl-A-37 hydroxylase MiaE [Sansalvadorimonas sp. 2012CJ34-2]|uniref:tRNA isopentenyl-2-thiomethyl-A-37 hydroxylase MiaE n=2 Tax=Parendozoicomonas callyspongiae TaxID=2942213 RepID=A0ABT0PD94_9GAMM|nr:tRNA isopentenyl-2-thiomethyl-A-37 hydroxylase MiaE [Sansalvadorimonas sp. 2012CJ34-2]MCL6268717.1 tRNA isopentenyl-2-thiomethyl-A-37 hydroxylase MiaE [Sansalvadorimonas sp. 2012CJ34-2]